MDKKKFVWLMDNCVARNGRELKRDQTYKVSDFAPAVVDEWIRTKAAKYTTTKSKEEEKS